MSVSTSFQSFAGEAPGQHAVWMAMVRGLAQASALDPKTEELAYLAVLAAAGMESGLPFHVAQAKSLGVTRDELVSALLVGLPAVGHRVVAALPAALAAYDA
jgi:AhpD family alkylhydroperoxidase